MYITMGWMGAFLAIFLFPYFGWPGLTLIALGGIFYTVSEAHTRTYHARRLPPSPCIETSHRASPFFAGWGGYVSHRTA